MVCFIRHVPVTLLTGITAAWLVVCPAARTLAGSIAGLGEMTADDANPAGPAASDPFANVIHFRMSMMAIEATGLLFVRPSENASDNGGFSSDAALLAFTGGGAPVPDAGRWILPEDTAAVSRNDETADVSSLVLAAPAPAAVPEQSILAEVSPRTAALPGLAALCAIGLGLAYGASSDAKQAKRRDKERQRSRGFRQMAAPIYAIEKPMRVRLNADPERDAEG